MTLFQIISAKYLQICLLPLRGGRVGLLFSVCKGKQLYSESNRFLGYWSNKFRKYLCNYLFYREISMELIFDTEYTDGTKAEGTQSSLRNMGIHGSRRRVQFKNQNYDYFELTSYTCRQVGELLAKRFCGFFVPLGTLCNLLAVNVCALCV